MNQDVIGYSTANFMARALATGLFISVCTIQRPSGTLTASGAPNDAYTDVSGLVDIACMDAPTSVAVKILSMEVRNQAEIMTDENRHVLLSGYYPTVVTGWAAGWRAIVDGTTYDIAGAECDSQHTQTRLELKAIAV